MVMKKGNDQKQNAEKRKNRMTALLMALILCVGMVSGTNKEVRAQSASQNSEMQAASESDVATENTANIAENTTKSAATVTHHEYTTEEVTPTGELIKLAKGATVLDFAFAIHTKLGCKCVSAKVNEKNVPIKYTLNNGDTVSIVTAPTQTPKRDWLNIVVTSKARVKIKQALREETAKAVDFAKEMLQRRFKNRKIEMEEPILMRYIKKKGFKTVTDFYVEIAEERLDPNQVIDEYLEQLRRETETNDHTEVRSAEEYITTTEVEEISTNKDVLVIDKNLTGIEYKLAKCCNPIYGDEVFGFVSTQGIKIHRMDCPNAQEMFSRFGYRIIQAKWSGKGDNGYIVTLRVIGRDDIAIVTNITSVISKETGVTLRSLNIDSVDGIFQGNFTVMVRDTTALNMLTKKINAVKGVKTVERLNS